MWPPGGGRQTRRGRWRDAAPQVRAFHRDVSAARAATNSAREGKTGRPGRPSAAQPAASCLPVQTPAAPNQPVGDQNPQQIIVAQLQQAQASLAQQGFQQVGQPFSGGLQPGQSWDLPTQMNVGYEYQIVGVCDRDCSDLDLRLFDGNGGLIIEDTSTSSQPNVGVIPSTSGTFNIQVHMYACTVAPCYYAVALYARPQQ